MDRAAADGPILFAYDGSEPAKASIREAGRQLCGGRSGIVVTIWPLLGDRPRPEDLEAEAERIAREGAALASAAGFAVQPLARGGEKVWSDIVAVADEHDASLVVLGSHSRNRIARAFLGSVATAVARYGSRPILVVHPA
jgi:nucleotide-binding universal stress UspA family protein